MRTVFSAATILALSAPVWAHEGAHLHPHGTEFTPVLAVLAFLAAAYLLYRAR